MQSIGEALKNAREQKGISLEQAEEDTKIRKRYLQALEDGEYSIIPGSVYVKGFLRNYANYLGLNQEEIMIEYKLLNSPVRENGPRTDIQEAINKRRTSNRTNRRANMITVVVALIALSTYAIYSFVFTRPQESPDANQNKGPVQTEKPLQTNNKQNKGAEKSNNKINDKPGTEDNKAGMPDQATPEKIDLVEGPDGKIPVAGDQVKVVLKGNKQPSWARVTVDGRIIFTGEIKPGEVKTYTGNNGVKIRLGNAGGVEVNVNGQELGTLGSFGEVVDKEYLKE